MTKNMALFCGKCKSLHLKILNFLALEISAVDSKLFDKQKVI